MNLKQIISHIDTALKANIKLSTQYAFGLAEFYYDGDKRYPGVIEGGNIIQPLMRDDYAVSWYHRTTVSEYSTVEFNYGDKLDKVQERIPVQLVINCNTIKLGQSLQTIKDIFASSIPSVLSKAVCESLQLFDCTIELVNAELNSNIVLREECSIPDVRVGVEHGLVAIRYVIQTTYRRGCITICEC